jgi:hypothetical protein
MASQTTCKHVDALRTSLQSLTHMQLNSSSAAKIRTDLTNIQTQLAALKGQGSGAFSSQINQLSASVSKVKKAASSMSNPPTSSQVTAVVTALAELKAKSQTARAAMNKECPPH